MGGGVGAAAQRFAGNSSCFIFLSQRFAGNSSDDGGNGDDGGDDDSDGGSDDGRSFDGHVGELTDDGDGGFPLPFQTAGTPEETAEERRLGHARTAVLTKYGCVLEQVLTQTLTLTLTLPRAAAFWSRYSKVMMRV